MVISDDETAPCLPSSGHSCFDVGGSGEGQGGGEGCQVVSGWGVEWGGLGGGVGWGIAVAAGIYQTKEESSSAREAREGGMLTQHCRV